LKDALVIPSSAIQRGAPGAFVYLVKADNTVTVQKVVLGPSQGESQAITSGLAVGDLVVTDGADKLKNGAKVSLPTAAPAPPAPAQTPAAPAGDQTPPAPAQTPAVPAGDQTPPVPAGNAQPPADQAPIHLVPPNPAPADPASPPPADNPSQPQQQQNGGNGQ